MDSILSFFIFYRLLISSAEKPPWIWPWGWVTTWCLFNSSYLQLTPRPMVWKGLGRVRTRVITHITIITTTITHQQSHNPNKSIQRRPTIAPQIMQPRRQLLRPIPLGRQLHQRRPACRPALKLLAAVAKKRRCLLTARLLLVTLTSQS